MSDGTDDTGRRGESVPSDDVRSRAAALLSEDTPHQRFVQYLVVGLVGVGVNEGVLYLVTGVAGLSYVVGGFLGRAVSISVNYVLNDSWTWGAKGDVGARGWLLRGGKYLATRVVGVAIGLAALVLFVELLGIHYLVANVLAIGVGVAWGFGISERWVWADGSTEPIDEWAARRGRQGLRFARRLGARARERFVGPRTPPRANGGLRTDGDRAPRSALVGALAATLGAIDRARRRRSIDPIREGAATAADRAADSLARAPGRTVDRLAAVDGRTWLVVALATGIGAAFTWYTVQLYEGYVLTGADFGSYVHMMWTTLNGEGFLQQGKFRANHPSGIYWGAHAALTLPLFLPIYALFPSPITLLVVKSGLIAASVVALWALAREWTDSTLVAAIAVASYAFNPFLWSAWSFDFQEQAMIPLLVFLAVYFYAKERHGLFLLFLLLTLFTNEFMVLIVGGFVVGLAVAAARNRTLRERWPVIAAAFGCVVLAHVVSGLVVAAFSEYGGFPVRSVAVPLQPHLDGPRVSVMEMAGAAIAHPDAATASLFVDFDRKVLYLFGLFLPVGFLSIADELSLPAVLPFVGFAWVLGRKAAYYTFGAHYPFYFLPFVYVGLVHVFSHRSLPTLSRGWARQLVVYVLVLNVVAFALVGTMNMRSIPADTDHVEVLDAAVASVPEEASLVTQNNVFPHVAERPDARFLLSPFHAREYREEVGPIAPEYVLFDTEHQRQWADAVINSFEGRLFDEYGLYEYQDGVWIFRRGYDGSPSTITGDEELSVLDGEWKRYHPEDFRLGRGEIEDDRIVGTGERAGIIWYGPYEVLPPGRYTAYFSVRVSGDGSIGSAQVALGEDHEVIATRTLEETDGWETVSISFAIDRPQPKLELRGEHFGDGGRIELRYASVVRGDRPSPEESSLTTPPSAAPSVPASTSTSTATSMPEPAPEPASRSAAAVESASVPGVTAG